MLLQVFLDRRPGGRPGGLREALGRAGRYGLLPEAVLGRESEGGSGWPIFRVRRPGGFLVFGRCIERLTGSASWTLQGVPEAVEGEGV